MKPGVAARNLRMQIEGPLAVSSSEQSLGQSIAGLEAQKALLEVELRELAADYAELQRRSVWLLAVNSIAAAINRPTDLNRILQTMVDEVWKVFAATRVVVVRLDPAGAAATVVAAAGASGGFRAPGET